MKHCIKFCHRIRITFVIQLQHPLQPRSNTQLLIKPAKVRESQKKSPALTVLHFLTATWRTQCRSKVAAPNWSCKQLYPQCSNWCQGSNVKYLLHTQLNGLPQHGYGCTPCIHSSKRQIGTTHMKSFHKLHLECQKKTRRTSRFTTYGDKLQEN